jgi:hypothetical protein
MLSSPAIPERNGNGALGLVLADDIFIELFYNLPWSERIFQKDLRFQLQIVECGSRIKQPKGGASGLLFAFYSAFRNPKSEITTILPP